MTPSSLWEASCRLMKYPARMGNGEWDDRMQNGTQMNSLLCDWLTSFLVMGLHFALSQFISNTVVSLSSIYMCVKKIQVWLFIKVMFPGFKIWTELLYSIKLYIKKSNKYMYVYMDLWPSTIGIPSRAVYTCLPCLWWSWSSFGFMQWRKMLLCLIQPPIRGQSSGTFTDYK